MQVVHWEGVPGSTRRGGRKSVGKGKQTSKGSIIELVTVLGSWGSFLLGNSGRWWRMSLPERSEPGEFPTTPTHCWLSDGFGALTPRRLSLPLC